MIRTFRAEVRVNHDAKVLFWKKKGESVMAEYAGTATADGWSIRIAGIRDRGESGNEYFRLAFEATHGDRKAWWNGRLFDNTHRAEGSRQPDYTGDLVMDRASGEKLRLAAWVRFDKPDDESTAWLSLDASEFRRAAAGASA